MGTNQKKHTLGPWVVEDAPDNRVAVYGGTVCVAVVGDKGVAAVDADAALISAAPDMLAALEYIMAWDSDWTVEQARTMARAAILKAKGEA